MMLPEDTVLDIVRAEHLSGYQVKLTFSEGAERIIDFEPFLSRSRNPMIRAYLDPKQFTNFRVDYGDLVWGDFDLCFPIADLYEGQI
jgi:hypothetical protein